MRLTQLTESSNKETIEEIEINEELKSGTKVKVMHPEKGKGMVVGKVVRYEKGDKYTAKGYVVSLPGLAKSEFVPYHKIHNSLDSVTGEEESYDDYHGDMSKEEYDKTVKDSEMEYTVWVGGTEANDNWLTYDEALTLYDKFKAQGYDDVQLDARIKQDTPQDIPMGIRPIPKEVTEKAKPDFLDLDKDGDKKEPMKKAGKERSQAIQQMVDTDAEWKELVKAREKRLANEAADADVDAIKDRDDFIKMMSAKPKSSNKAIDTIKKIVADKQNMQVKFDDGKMKVDLYTASAVSQVYDALKPETQEKVDNMLRTKEGMLKMSNFAFKKFNEAIHEGRLDELFWAPLAAIGAPLAALGAPLAALGGVARAVVGGVARAGAVAVARNKGKLAVGSALAHMGSKDDEEEENGFNRPRQSFKGPTNSQTVTASKYENKKVYSKDGELLEIGPVLKAVVGNVIGNMVKDKLGKEHDANSPQGKMIINMKKKDPNNKDKDGDGKDDKTGLPVTGSQEVKGDKEKEIAQARKDIMKNKRKGLVPKLGKAVIGAFSNVAQKSGFGNPLSASKYSPEDKSVEMMKEAMDKANSK
jgi:hypothetical protein